jgi:glycerol-3-phosphate acyltransferase PlsY
VIAMVVLFQLSPLYAVYAIAAAGLIWLFHVDNIQRLLSGSERRIEWRR